MAYTREKLDKGWVQCRAIIELLGAPKKYVEDTLHAFVAKIKDDKDIEIIKEDYAKPKAQGKMFGAFVELEALFKDVPTLVWFCFDYMPASVEVVEPKAIKYNITEFNNFLNDLQARLHMLDMNLKKFKMENTVLRRNAGLLLRNNVMINLMQKDKDKKELSKNTGIPEDQLKPFLDKMEKDGWIKKKKNKYKLVKK